MALFDNQYNFRVNNQLQILFELRQGALSINELSTRIKLSFTATNKIVDQLCNKGVVVLNKKNLNNKKGRNPTFVKINTKVGVTCSIDLSGDDLIVAISDLRSRIIVQKSIKTDYFIDEATLELLSETIKELMLASEVDDRKLLGISIAAPGLINKITKEIADSYRLKNVKNTSIATFFSNRFNVPTNVYNDVNIGLVGERFFGCIPVGAKNYMFVHLGNGCSFAFAFDGKLYQGSNGYSGELSTFRNNDFFAPVYTNNHLEELSHIGTRIEKRNPKVKLTLSPHIVDIDELVRLIGENDPIALEELENNARRNAAQLIAYNDILDLEYIVISGSILKLGDIYKDLLLKYIKQLDINPFRARILFSSMEYSSTLLGSVYQANNVYFMNRLEEITNEKNPANDYDISEAFGNDISL